jgi:hypothetical protein
MSFRAEVTGMINGQSIHVSGEGVIDPSRGLTDGDYHLGRLPSGFDPLLLSAFLVCGYPHATGKIDDAENLFANGSYEYRRILHLRDGGEITQRTKIRVDGDETESHMHLRGWANVPTLAQVEPVVESWEPDGPGGIRGHFTIGWTTPEGDMVTGDTYTTYQIDTGKVLPGMLHRFIYMKTLVDTPQGILREVQTEGLCRSLPWDLWIRDSSARSNLEDEFMNAVPRHPSTVTAVA